jgi:hypothetical protein
LAGWYGRWRKNINAVLLPSLTLREDDRAQYAIDRPWHCPLKRGELGQLIPTIQEVVEEELDFSGDMNSPSA